MNQNKKLIGLESSLIQELDESYIKRVVNAHVWAMWPTNYCCCQDNNLNVSAADMWSSVFSNQMCSDTCVNILKRTGWLVPETTELGEL